MNGKALGDLVNCCHPADETVVESVVEPTFILPSSPKTTANPTAVPFIPPLFWPKTPLFNGKPNGGAVHSAVKYANSSGTAVSFA